MSALEAVKLARKGLPVRSVAKKAGVPIAVAEKLVKSSAPHTLKGLQDENVRLKAALRKLVEQYDAYAEETAQVAKQAECVVFAANKLLTQFDRRLRGMFKLCNEVEGLLKGLQ